MGRTGKPVQRQVKYGEETKSIKNKRSEKHPAKDAQADGKFCKPTESCKTSRELAGLPDGKRSLRDNKIIAE